MPDKDGVEIYKRFYPWPERFRLGDPVLVKAITDMSWPDFVTALAEQEDAYAAARETGEEVEVDQVVLAGLIAVAFWQGNPQMSRDKARRAVERIPQDEIEIVEGDEGDVGPPALSETEAVGAGPSTTSSASAAQPEAQEATEIPPDSTSDETNPNGSGSPGSLSALPESLPA